MAFVRENCERVAGGRRKLFIYDALADAAAATIVAGYFDAIRNEVDKGDIIIVVSATNTAINVRTVTSARGAQVTVV